MTKKKTIYKKDYITGKKFPLYRVFNGERYQSHSVSTTKKDAEMRKNHFRKQGYKVRIVKYGRVYHTYTRKG